MDHSFITIPSDDIYSVIKKASLFGGTISYPTSSRNEMLNIDRIELDKHGKITLELSGDIMMKEKWPVSVTLNYRDITFQFDPKFYAIEGKKIISTLPEKARAIKERIDKRYILPHQSNIKTSMYRIEKRGGGLELDLKILDLSKKGLAILVQDPKEENALLRNDHLWIKSINGITLEQPIFATVVYVSHRHYKDALDLKAGLQLKEPIPGPVFRDLQKLCNLVLCA
jgi:hypothetical protein